MPPQVHFTPDAWQQLRMQAEAAYPFEGCGLLLGPFGAEKRASEVIVLKNALRDEGRPHLDQERLEVGEEPVHQRHPPIADARPGRVHRCAVRRPLQVEPLPVLIA